MAAQAGDFISPAGEITEEMFPGEDLEERAQGYIAAVTLEIGGLLTGVKLDTAIAEGVYVKFYEAAAAKSVPQPIMGNLVDQGSMQWAQNRADLYLRMADMHRERYDAAFLPEATVTPSRYPSGSVPIIITAP